MPYTVSPPPTCERRQISPFTGHTAYITTPPPPPYLSTVPYPPTPPPTQVQHGLHHQPVGQPGQGAVQRQGGGGRLCGVRRLAGGCAQRGTEKKSKGEKVATGRGEGSCVVSRAGAREGDNQTEKQGKRDQEKKEGWRRQGARIVVRGCMQMGTEKMLGIQGKKSRSFCHPKAVSPPPFTCPPPPPRYRRLGARGCRGRVYLLLRR